MPAGWQAVGDQFGWSAVKVLRYIHTRLSANYAHDGLQEVILPDRDLLAEEMRVSPASISNVKSALEGCGVLVYTRKRRACTINAEALRRLARRKVALRKSPGSGRWAKKKSVSASKVSS